MSCSCKAFLSAGHLFHALSYHGDIGGWREAVVAGANARLNDPATGYVAKDGSYVVRNDRTGAIVQVSDKNDKNWVAPWD
ncbi:colicin E5-related ribonuclease [Pseudomonas sp. PB3P13]